MVRKLWVLIISFILCNVFMGTTVFAEGNEAALIGNPRADFKLTAYKNGTEIDLTNRSVYKEIYSSVKILNCKDLSIGATEYEWFISQDRNSWKLLDTVRNPVFTMPENTTTFIKLRINHDDNLVKEAYVSYYYADTEQPAASDINFKIVYASDGKTIDATNKVIPDNVKDLPYKVSLINLSPKTKTCEWFVKFQNGGYNYLSCNPNAELEIPEYGPVFVKVRINNNDSLTKEYFVTSREYSSTTSTNTTTTKEYSVSKDVYRFKTQVQTVTTYYSIASNDIPEMPKLEMDKKDSPDCQFKISYNLNGVMYNVTDGMLPLPVTELPYKLYLTNTSKNVSENLWYIKFPGSDYMDMDISQNPIATIWQYGTISFKLKNNNNDKLMTEHTVTAYSPDNLESAAKAEEIYSNMPTMGEEVDFNILYTHKGDIYNVSDSALPQNMAKIPYNVYLKNTSKNDKIYEWFVKTEGSEYKKVNDPNLTISNYGPVTIKLRLNGSDLASKERTVTSYIESTSLKADDISAASENTRNGNASCDFKLSFISKEKIYDVTNNVIPELIKKVPYKIYCTNLSKGASKYTWYIKLPGKAYVPMDNSENPEVTIWQSSKTYIKLVLNDDFKLSKEYFVDTLVDSEVPRISNNFNNLISVENNLSVNWKKVDKCAGYLFSLTNITKGKILMNNIKTNQNFMVVPSNYLSNGSKFSIKVIALNNDQESGLFDEVYFGTDGDLNLDLDYAFDKYEYNNSILSAAEINPNMKITGKLHTLSDKNYFMFNVNKKSDFTLSLTSESSSGYGIAILDSNGAVIKELYKQLESSTVNYESVLKKGMYYLKVFNSDKVLADKPYNLEIGCKEIINTEPPIITILSYHCIDENIFGNSDLFISPSVFEKQMKFLKDNNYDVITFDELDKANDFDKPVIITFDDGYEDNYLYAYPILKKYNFNASIFLVSNLINGQNTLKEPEIRKMRDIINFQAHTLSHPDLTKLSDKDLRSELKDPKDAIYRITGEKVDVLAYPMGLCNENIEKMASNYYKYAVISYGGSYTVGEDTYRIKRMDIKSDSDLKSLSAKD